MKCTHDSKMYPVQDNLGWIVGYVCDCGYFKFRKDLQPYEIRAKSFFKKHNFKVRK